MECTQWISVSLYPPSALKCISLNAEPRLMEKALLMYERAVAKCVSRYPLSQWLGHTQSHVRLWGPMRSFGQLLTAHQLCSESRSFNALFLFGDRVWPWGSQLSLGVWSWMTSGTSKHVSLPCFLPRWGMCTFSWVPGEGCGVLHCILEDSAERPALSVMVGRKQRFSGACEMRATHISPWLVTLLSSHGE